MAMPSSQPQTKVVDRRDGERGRNGSPSRRHARCGHDAPQRHAGHGLVGLVARQRSQRQDDGADDEEVCWGEVGGAQVHSSLSAPGCAMHHASTPQRHTFGLAAFANRLAMAPLTCKSGEPHPNGRQQARECAHNHLQAANRAVRGAGLECRAGKIRPMHTCALTQPNRGAQPRPGAPSTPQT